MYLQTHRHTHTYTHTHTNGIGVSNELFKGLLFCYFHVFYGLSFCPTVGSQPSSKHGHTHTYPLTQANKKKNKKKLDINPLTHLAKP